MGVTKFKYVLAITNSDSACVVAFPILSVMEKA